jgi:hypothetical protein
MQLLAAAVLLVLAASMSIVMIRPDLWNQRKRRPVAVWTRRG